MNQIEDPDARTDTSQTSQPGMRNCSSSSVLIRSSLSTSNRSKSTGLVYDDRMLQHRHEWFRGEQESPARLQRAYERCYEEGLVSRCILVPSKHISEDALALIHDRTYIRIIKRSRTFTRQELYELSGQFDGVFFNEFTWNCASLAAGSLKSLTHLVAQGRLINGLALIRPPGHHAMHAEACGYCVFNNVAVAAASLLDPPPVVLKTSAGEDPQVHPYRKSRKMCNSVGGDNMPNSNRHSSSVCSGLTGMRASIRGPQESGTVTMERILILDWDVHHGQGTQYAFYNDNRVLYISIHRHEKGKFWPNLREANFDFVGHGLGCGFNVNVPLDQIDMTDADYLAVFHQLVLPIAMEYNPQLVIVSCGFDAAIGCPEGRMWLTPALFGHFVHQLKMLAGGKLVVALEGGYYVDSLAESAVHVLKALLGDPLTPLRLNRPPCKSIRKTIELCTTALRPYWKSLWIQDVSRIIDRPNLSHLPLISWPLVRRIVWPETNPLVPEPLSRCIHDLMNHGIAMPLPEPETQPYLLLLRTTLPVHSDKVNTEMNQSGFVSSRRQSVFPWPKELLVKLNTWFHIHFYRETDSISSPYTVHGKRPAHTQPEEISNPPEKRRRHHANQAGLDTLSSSTTDPVQMTTSACNETVVSSPATSRAPTPCGCSLATTKFSRTFSFKKWNSAESLISTPALSNALEKAVTDLFLRRFTRVLISGHEITPSELVNTIGNLPEQLLYTYQGRLLRNRMGKPLPQPVIFPLHNAIHGRKYFQGTYAAEWTSESTLDTFDVAGNNESASTHASTSGDDQSGKPLHGQFSLTLTPKAAGSEQACRILVLDLTGAKDPGTCATLTKQSNSESHIHCDLLWCSLYTGSFAEQLASCPSLFRAAQLFRTHHTTRSHCSTQWLRIPLVHSRRPTPGSSKSNPAPTMATGCNSDSPITKQPKDALCSNLCATLFHFLLPIAYEYGPDLVYIRIGTDWIETGSDRSDMALGQLLHLMGGLGSALIVSVTSMQPPSTTVMNSLLGLTVESIQTNLTEPMVPTAKMQTVLRQLLRVNHSRWKSLRYADSLPKWR